MDRSSRFQGMSDTERLRLFVSSVSDYALYMLTPDGYICSWNLGAQRCTGYTQDEIIGQHFSVFYTEEERASGKPALSGDIRALLDKGSSNPKSAIADLLGKAGIAFTSSPDGTPTL